MDTQELPFPDSANITPDYKELVMEQSSVFYDILEALERIDQNLNLAKEKGPFVKESIGKLVNNFLEICGTGCYTKGDSKRPDEVFYRLHLINERIGKAGGLPFIRINDEHALFKTTRERADDDYWKRSKKYYEDYEQEYWAAPPLSGFRPL